MTKFIEFAGRRIGEGQPCFIIAEAGVNHNGDMQNAKQLVDAAVLAGADAVKFQTFVAESLVSSLAPKARYQLSTTDDSESQLEMLKRLELTPEAHREIKDYCRETGILFLSTPFDEDSVDLLIELDIPVFKISSGDITNLPFLDYVARKGRPVLLSTGMSEMDEVRQAVATVRDAPNRDLVLLQCVSSYPAQPADVNLRAMQSMWQEFGTPVGYSDHTEGIAIALAAVALGACVIEKHFTLDRNLPGPDHRASLEPNELSEMIRGVRGVEAALGTGLKAPTASEIDTARVARRSLTAALDIPAGTQLTRDMIAIRRPGTGLPPAQLSSLIGRTVRADIDAGSLLSLEMLTAQEPNS
ncbi:MAG TPA: N-acetylneuraminate synthase [Pyrinomonadaceae bacterium]|nr:N-acetylneuraminate synthase [Pyrinomonadaceae bacterium]